MPKSQGASARISPSVSPATKSDRIASAEAAPLLSDVLAPAFASTTTDQVQDAVVWWGKLTGKIPADWTQPNEAVTVAPYRVARLRNAAMGIAAVARVTSIINLAGENSIPDGSLSEGLHLAMVALADSLVGELEGG